ncbi:hypothetical protein [Paenibacillus rhizophilus]|uniref:Uncharacterized protein n=1 Tax=Paenibacillus rhizophilus TaxID=1850366 RepID=A0A3N9P6I3_9BACL|nr:hypothetical protein [Paenibacillus rhizophilus]RQW11833.1 hypothetical protein EH198_09140 [Paenibacillus rhizophilus]
MNREEADRLFATGPQDPCFVRAGIELVVNVKKVTNLDREKRRVSFDTGEVLQVEDEYWDNFIQMYEQRENL